jgi:hypothetical protein
MFAWREGSQERPGDVIAESLFEVELELHDAAARLGTRPDRHLEDLLGNVRRMSHLHPLMSQS